MEVRDPCSLCGNKDYNLVDGYFYCKECGTQDENVRETFIEHRTLADGTFSQATKRKIHTAVTTKVEMSGEWYKWHAFNFVLLGMADELVALGASQSFKMRLLWIWTRYIQKYQNKAEMGLTQNKEQENSGDRNQNHSYEKETETNSDDEQNKKKENDVNNSERDIKFVTKAVILSMIYVALNLDRSVIQLSHLFRFIHEGRLTYETNHKFIPKEINKKSIPQYDMYRCGKLCSPNFVRAVAMTLFNKLNLGTPVVPNLKLMVNNYVKELCLPVEFKNLVLSLMHMVSCDFLDIDTRTKLTTVRMPDYEGVVMSYVLVALKMTFGLDDNYEWKLSNIVDEINEKENYLKSDRFTYFMSSMDRLFSFREWSNYLQLRKIMLCKYNLSIAKSHHYPIDDYVFIEHMEERPVSIKCTTDELGMDILNKLIFNNDMDIVPKENFPPTLTPFTTYTEVVLNHLQDDKIKILLNEDFSKYSLKYACEMELVNSEDFINVVIGISDSNKAVNGKAIRFLDSNKINDVTMVYVKNCDNKNWLKTNPPKLEHITEVDKNGNDKESDHGYDSNNEHVINEEEVDDDKKNVTESLEEEDETKNIFDDHFDHLDTSAQVDDALQVHNEQNASVKQQPDVFQCCNDDDNFNDISNTSKSNYFNQNTFNRETTIKELILHACKKYRIPIPAEYKPKQPRKRQQEKLEDNGATAPKRSRRDKMTIGETKKKVDELLTAYYNNLDRDVLHEITQLTRETIQNLGNTAEESFALVDIDQSNVVLDNIINTNSQHSIRDLNQTPSMQTNGSVEDLESTLPGNEDDDIDDTNDLSKSDNDSRFNEKTHDTKQLYIKIETDDSLDIFDIDKDPKSEEILDRKIEEFKKRWRKYIHLTASDFKKQELSDSDDDLPLIVYKEEKFLEGIQNEKEENLEVLIKNSDKIQKFRYWLRHYRSKNLNKSLNVGEKFDLELKDNCPKSFSFLINECASILTCTTYTLYKYMQNLEDAIKIKCK